MDVDDLLLGTPEAIPLHEPSPARSPPPPPRRSLVVPTLIAALTAAGGWRWSLPHAIGLGLLATLLVWLDRRLSPSSTTDDAADLPTRAGHDTLAPTLPTRDDPPYDPARMETEQAHLRYTQDQIAQRVQLQRTMDPSILGGAVITRNAELRRRLERAEHIARTTDHALLIHGETGTGKGVVVPALFEAKRAAGRVTGKLVWANCAVFRDQHGLDDLFGHAKGAYTGAEGARAGLMMQAHDGTLFLDELGEFELSQQAKVLVAIESKQFRPMGSDHPVTSNFGVISATNRDLDKMIRDGSFREELYARVGQYVLELMPLRERPEDVEHNVQIELELEGQRRGTKVAMVPAAYQQLIDFATSPEALWPDNFRGLAGAVGKLAAYAKDVGAIDVGVVDEVIAELKKKWSRSKGDGLDGLVATETLAKLPPLPRHTLAELVRVSQVQRTVARSARALFSVGGVVTGTEASRLVKYLARLGLTFEDIVRPRA